MRCIFFDCDGVLIDSEYLSHIVDVELKKKYGIQFTLDEHIEKFSGLAETTPYVLEHLKSLPDNFLKESKSAKKKVYLERLKCTPHIKEALDNLTIPYYLVSGSNFHDIEYCLGIVGLWPYFKGKVFSRDLVERPKPAPDLYLHALEKLNLSSSECIAIEDSVAGVKAASDAGLEVLGYTGASHMNESMIDKLKSTGVKHIFDDMRKLPSILATFN